MLSIEQKIKQRFGSSKTIAILGFGKEGYSTYRFIRKYFPNVKIVIHDKDETIKEKNKELQSDSLIEFALGKQFGQFRGNEDWIFKSPGVSLFKNNITIPDGILISQTALFLELFREQTIGITGTKGKSTTSSLIYHILEQNKGNTLLVGNIGVPPLESIPQIDEHSLIVFEMSSHQLEHCTISPKYAVLLNIFQEHLDHYSGYQAYIDAKLNITRFQKEGDYLFFGYDNKILRQNVENLNVKNIRIPFSLLGKVEAGVYVENNNVIFNYKNKKNYCFDISIKRNIPGQHNLSNILCATAVSIIIGVEPRQIADSVASFKSLPHRLEYVGEIQGIHFYNDSIATIPEAAEAAVESLEEVHTLIAGGYNRGIDYNQFGAFLAKKSIPLILLMGEAGDIMHRHLNDLQCSSEIIKVGSLDEAVELAFKHTPVGKCCLLSPAAASYDRFKNFEERGNIFKNLVLQRQKK